MNYKHDRFLECMKVIFHAEGGYSDDPKDRGDRTNLGITEITLKEAYRRKIVGHDDIKKITKEEALLIYFSMYWKKCGAYKLPEPLDLFVFDCAVNSGPMRAIVLLQHVLCAISIPVTVDGLLGPNTLESVNASVQVYLEEAYLKRRIGYYINIVKNDPSQKRFLNGWKNRIKRLADITGTKLD